MHICNMNTKNVGTWKRWKEQTFFILSLKGDNQVCFWQQVWAQTERHSLLPETEQHKWGGKLASLSWPKMDQNKNGIMWTGPYFNCPISPHTEPYNYSFCWVKLEYQILWDCSLSVKYPWWQWLIKTSIYSATEHKYTINKLCANKTAAV